MFSLADDGNSTSLTCITTRWLFSPGFTTIHNCSCIDLSYQMSRSAPCRLRRSNVPQCALQAAAVVVTGVTVRSRLFSVKWQAGPASQDDVIDGTLLRLSFWGRDAYREALNARHQQMNYKVYKLTLLHVVLWHFTSEIAWAELSLLNFFLISLRPAGIFRRTRPPVAEQNLSPYGHWFPSREPVAVARRTRR